MKLIIAGSRDFSNWDYFINHFIKMPEWLLNTVDEIVSGGAQGADYLGECLAQSCGLRLTRFLADWEKHGKRAGMIRNTQMAEYADGLIAFWDGQSSGTNNMIKQMKRYDDKFAFIIRTDLNIDNICRYQ
jgi:hypothetical protein